MSHPPTRVVVSIRSDFLDRVPEDQAFMAELSRGLFFLNAPIKDGLREALVQPAEMAGYHFEKPAIEIPKHAQPKPATHAMSGTVSIPHAGSRPNASATSSGAQP